MGDLRRLAAWACLAVMGLSASAAQASSSNDRLWIIDFGARPITENYQSDVHEVAGGLNAAIASWNAKTSAQSWIEVRVRARIGARWTKWYAMGEWSASRELGHRHSIARQEDADGRIDTDTLVLKKRAQALQVRVAFHSNAGSPSPSVRLLAVVTDVDTGVVARVHSRLETPLELDVPERSQRVAGSPDEVGGGGDAWCSPTSTSMVMGYWAHIENHPEWDADVAQAADGTYDSVYDGCGNWPFNVAFASERGLGGWVARLPDLEALRALLARGVPVIASIKARRGELDGAPYRQTNGHLLVVRGFTARGDVIVNDPYARPGHIRRVYRRDQFERAWQGGSNGAVYVIAPPNMLAKLQI